MWKRKEKGRRKNIKAKLIVDVDEEVLALFNFVTKVGKKIIDVLEGILDRKFLNQAVVFTKLFLFSGKVWGVF